MSRRTKKNPLLRLAVPTVVVVLLSFVAYRAAHRWRPSLFRGWQRPTPHQAAQRFCRALTASPGGGYRVETAASDSLFALTLTDLRDRPFALTNLMLARRALSCGIDLLSAAEDRKRERLELAYGLAGRPLVSVSVRRAKRDTVGQPADRPRIALIVYGIATADKAAKSLLAEMPEVRTLIVDRPVATAGRELLVSLPLEPIGYPKQDPGPGTILLDDSDSKIAAKLAKRFRALDRPAGFAVEAGSRALKDERVTGLVARFCREKGMVLFEPRFTANSLAREQAAASGCPYLTATAYVEPQAAPKAAAARITAALRAAAAGRSAVVMVPARHDVLRALRQAITAEIRQSRDFVGVRDLGGH